MDEKDFDRKGRNYENLIRKAFQCKSGNLHGANQLLMIELLVYQNKLYINSGNVPYEWKFNKVKLYIQKALAKFKKKKSYPNSHEEFMSLIVQLNKSETVDDLVSIVHGTLAKIIRIENELKNIA